jgi:hypothetical protein
MDQNDRDDNREHGDKPERPDHDHKGPHRPGRDVPPPRPHSAPIPMRCI